MTETLYINKFQTQVHFLHQTVQCSQNVTTHIRKFERELIGRAKVVGT